jgi:hypothetical protein
MELTELVPLLDSGVTVVFAVIVWRELHAVREQLAGTLTEIAERLTAVEIQTRPGPDS